MAAQVKKGRRHTSFLTVLVIAILIALVGVQLIHLRAQIESAQNQLTALKSDLDSAKQANDALEARELIKCRVLENSMLTAREACDELSALTRSEQVQVIGTKFVLYRPTHKKDKKDKIVLPKAAKKTV